MTVWPLRPNWRDPYRLTYEFKTEILTSRSGKEQRRAQRTTPRKTVEFLVSAARERRIALRGLLNANQGPYVTLPEVTAGVRSTSAMGVSGNNFAVATIPYWAAAGATAVLIDGDRAELRTVSGAASGVITFAEPAVTPWPVHTRICPALSATLADSLNGSQLATNLEEITLTFEVDPGSERPRDPAEPEVMWNGREVFLARANWGDARDVSFTRDMRRVDFGKRVKIVLPTSFPVTTRTADYIGHTPEEAQRYLDFFLRHKGRRGEFYCPSDSDDVRLAAPTGNAFMFVDGVTFAAQYANDSVNRALSFRMKSGARFYRTVTAITVQGAQSRIQLGQALPSFTHPEDVEVISWLPVLRHASDNLTIEWLTDSVTKVRFNYLSLPANSPE